MSIVVAKEMIENLLKEEIKISESDGKIIWESDLLINNFVVNGAKVIDACFSTLKEAREADKAIALAFYDAVGNIMMGLTACFVPVVGAGLAIVESAILPFLKLFVEKLIDKDQTDAKRDLYDVFIDLVEALHNNTGINAYNERVSSYTSGEPRKLFEILTSIYQLPATTCEDLKQVFDRGLRYN